MKGTFNAYNMADNANNVIILPTMFQGITFLLLFFNNSEFTTKYVANMLLDSFIRKSSTLKYLLNFFFKKTTFNIIKYKKNIQTNKIT